MRGELGSCWAPPRRRRSTRPVTGPLGRRRRLPVETGVWRVRLEVSLRQRPDLAGGLAGVVSTARALRPV